MALAPPWCERCGAPADRSVPACVNCPPDEIAIARAPFAFDGPARAAVHHLKYRGVRGVGRALAAAMTTCVPGPADLVTWVPSTRRRAAERGFDQAKVLAVRGRTGRARAWLAPACVLHGPAGPARRGGTPGGDARVIHRARAGHRAPQGAARRRCANDRGDGRLVRRGAASIGCLPRVAGRGCPDAPPVRTTCLYSIGPSSGSVVARGSSPVVDASRGRNDPRKATLGR